MKGNGGYSAAISQDPSCSLVLPSCVPLVSDALPFVYSWPLSSLYLVKDSLLFKSLSTRLLLWIEVSPSPIWSLVSMVSWTLLSLGSLGLCPHLAPQVSVLLGSDWQGLVFPSWDSRCGFLFCAEPMDHAMDVASFLRTGMPVFAGDQTRLPATPMTFGLLCWIPPT